MPNSYQRYLFVLLTYFYCDNLTKNATVYENEIILYFISMFVIFIINGNSTDIYLLKYFYTSVCVPIYF